MTDEARDAFTREKMDWEKWDGLMHMVKGGTVYTKAWLYDARIALEGEACDFKYEFCARVEGYVLFSISEQVGGTYDTLDAAIEAGVMDWFNRHKESQCR